MAMYLVEYESPTAMDYEYIEADSAGDAAEQMRESYPEEYELTTWMYVDHERG